MLSIRQTSILPLLLLVPLPIHLQLFPRPAFAAVVPSLPEPEDIVRYHPSVALVEESPLPLPADVDNEDDSEKKKLKGGTSPPDAINSYYPPPSTNGDEQQHYNYYYPLDDDVIRRRLVGEAVVVREDGDKVEGTQTGEQHHLEWSINYEDAINRIEGPAVIANKWKRHLIAGPTFDNCPSGTRWVRNECREVVFLD